MADISVFVSPNNTEYNIKDATARGWKGAANGTAELDANGKVPSSQLPAMTGATSSAAGTAGCVPAPAAGDNNKFLRGDGTWAEGGGGGGGLETLIISTSITNASGQYTNTISDSRITSDMIAYDIAYGTPSVIKDDVEVECDNGEITISCDNAVGTTTVTLYIMGCTSLTVAEGVSY